MFKNKFVIFFKEQALPKKLHYGETKKVFHLDYRQFRSSTLNQRNCLMLDYKRNTGKQQREPCANCKVQAKVQVKFKSSYAFLANVQSMQHFFMCPHAKRNMWKYQEDERRLWTQNRNLQCLILVHIQSNYRNIIGNPGINHPNYVTIHGTKTK